MGAVTRLCEEALRRSNPPSVTRVASERGLPRLPDGWLAKTACWPGTRRCEEARRRSNLPSASSVGSERGLPRLPDGWLAMTGAQAGDSSLRGGFATRRSSPRHPALVPRGGCHACLTAGSQRRRSGLGLVVARRLGDEAISPRCHALVPRGGCHVCLDGWLAKTAWGLGPRRCEHPLGAPAPMGKLDGAADGVV